MSEISIIHRQCGQEAFKYTGDTSPGMPIIASLVVDGHPDYPATVGAKCVCKSCGRPTDLRDLYPQRADRDKPIQSRG